MLRHLLRRGTAPVLDRVRPTLVPRAPAIVPDPALTQFRFFSVSGADGDRSKIPKIPFFERFSRGLTHFTYYWGGDIGKPILISWDEVVRCISLSISVLVVSFITVRSIRRTQELEVPKYNEEYPKVSS